MKKIIEYAGVRIAIESPERIMVEAVANFFKTAGCPERRSAGCDLVISLNTVPHLIKQKRKLMEGRGLLTRQRGQGLFSEIYMSEDDFLFYFGVAKALFLVSPDKALIQGWVQETSTAASIRFLQVALLEPVRFLLHFCGIFFIHASGVALGDQGILFIGAPGAGKSNTALQLVKAGYQFLSDDKIGIQKNKNQIEIFFSPEWVGLRPRAGHLFREVRKKILRQGVRLFSSHEKIKIPMNTLYPGRTQGKAIPRVMIFLKKTSRNRLLVSSLSKKEALLALLKENVILFSGKFAASVGQKHLNAFSDLIDQISVFRLEYSMDRFAEVEPLVTKLFHETQNNLMRSAWPR